MRLFFLLLFSLLHIYSCSSTKTVQKVDDQQITRNYKIQEYSGPKKKIAVTSFENATRFGKRRLGSNSSNVLISELSKTVVRAENCQQKTHLKSRKKTRLLRVSCFSSFEGANLRKPTKKRKSKSR